MKGFRRCSVVTNKWWENSSLWGMSRHQAMKASVQWRCNIELHANATGGRKSWRPTSRNWKLGSLEEQRIPKQTRHQEFAKSKEIQTGKNLSEWNPHQKRTGTRCGKRSKKFSERRSTLKIQKHGMGEFKESGDEAGGKAATRN